MQSSHVICNNRSCPFNNNNSKKNTIKPFKLAFSLISLVGFMYTSLRVQIYYSYPNHNHVSLMLKTDCSGSITNCVRHYLEQIV